MNWAIIGILLAAILSIGSLCVWAVHKLKKLEKHEKSLEADRDLLQSQYDTISQKYGPLLDLEKAASGLQSKIEGLSALYAQSKGIYDSLSAEVASLEENVNDMSFGLYKPHFKFDSSDEYKRQLTAVYERKKHLVKANMAAACNMPWTVNGSRRDGERMTKQQIKVMMRAFNAECDAAIAKVAWNNVARMEERIAKSFKAINDMGLVNHIAITPTYAELALKELRLAYEYEVKRHEEKEEQRAIRERMREEELAQREFERAKKEAETEEARYQKALEKARAECESATGAELVKSNSKVQELEQRLAEAQAKMERAVSMAQLTKSGYVYVISNTGSFGEDVYKIGMTRRLDPQERVDELGSASVPFPYDVHAMMYCQDAPNLEHQFHRQFTERRLNLVNMRKEFFRVTLDEIEAFARMHQAEIQFTKMAEAREYRETLARIEKTMAEVLSPIEPLQCSKFPDELTTVLK